MTTALVLVGVFTFLGALVMAAGLVAAYRAIPRLAASAPPRATVPAASIVVAARDEARGIEDALRSLLAQDYRPCEVVVVDDRSSDGTGEILDRLSATAAGATGPVPLRVVHVRELPRGWLGKNHALQRGAEAARGELLLFTDADVVLAPDALSRAVGALEAERLDHLAVGPDIESPTLPLELVVTFFGMAFTLYMRPWKAHDPRSRSHIGIGAFNLLRAATYRGVGGHTRIALRPDDDIKLGKLVKRAGGRQRLFAGQGLVRVEWYRSLPELVRGLQKNSFAGLEYSLPRAIGAVMAGFVVHVWPFVAVWVTTGVARLLYAATVAILVGAYAASARLHRGHPWLALAYPVAALVFLWVVCVAVTRTVVRGGIDWRGTWYSLDELKRNVVS